MMWIVTESGPPGARQRHWAAGQWNSCVGQRSFTLIRSWGSWEPSICDLKFGHSSSYTQLKATESQSRSCFVPEFTVRPRRGHSFCATAIRGIVFQQSRRILGCRLKLLAAWLLLLRSLTNLTETMNTLFVSCCLFVIYHYHVLSDCIYYVCSISIIIVSRLIVFAFCHNAIEILQFVWHSFSRHDLTGGFCWICQKKCVVPTSEEIAPFSGQS